MVMLLNVHDETDLLPDYNEPAIYIPSLKSLVTFGHFVLFQIDHERVVGQLLRRDIVSTNAIVSVLLPLYDQGTLQHINSVTILPPAIIHSSCENSSELVYISKVAVVPVCCIVSLAFVFLARDVMDYIFHLQGMRDAFLIRFKYCLKTASLVELNNATFMEFPDLHPEHENRYCECIGRSIFCSIEFLRQELWRILCRYGQSQGHFPKGTVKMSISPMFSYYVLNYLSLEGIDFISVFHPEIRRRIQYKLMYRMVEAKDSYFLFDFDSEAKIAALQKLIGEMSVVGVRVKKPRKGEEFQVNVNCTLNMSSRIELYLGKRMLKVKVHAFKHIIGADTCNHAWLSMQLAQRAPCQQQDEEATRSIRLNSRFDYNNSLFKVVSASNQGVEALCLWGESKGQTMVFPSVNEVLQLVNQKRG